MRPLDFAGIGLDDHDLRSLAQPLQKDRGPLLEVQNLSGHGLIVGYVEAARAALASHSAAIEATILTVRERNGSAEIV